MSILTDDQVQGFLLSLADARGAAGFTEKEAEHVVRWAAGAMAEFSIFQAILNGDMYIDVNDKGECVFGITDQGASMARSMVLGGGSNQVQ